MQFIKMYALREMRRAPGWFAGLFFTDGLLVYLFGLLCSRILRENDAFEILMHCILLVPLLILLAFAVLAVLYRQKLLFCRQDYSLLRGLGFSDKGILSIQCFQTVLVSGGAAAVFAPLSVLTTQFLRRMENDALWQSGWRNRSAIPYILVAYGILLTASLLCCIFVFRKQYDKPPLDRWSRRFTMKQILKKPHWKTYARIRRNRVRQEGKRICAGLMLLHILPILFWILMTDLVLVPAAAPSDNLLRLSGADGLRPSISHMLVQQIERLEGVTLEEATCFPETVPPMYRAVTFRLEEEHLQETVSAIRRMIDGDNIADSVIITVPRSAEGLASGSKNKADAADFCFVLLLFVSACLLSFSGTGMTLSQYCRSRLEELQILTTVGLSIKNCFRMLWETIGFWMTGVGMFSLFLSGGVWILYDWAVFLETRDLSPPPYRISAELLRSCICGGIWYIILMYIMGIFVLWHFLLLCITSGKSIHR